MFLRDDYLFDDSERIWLVIMNSHSQDRVFAVLKYVLSSDTSVTLWRGKYRRLMDGYFPSQIIDIIGSNEVSEFRFYSDVYETHLTAIPKKRINIHLKPEKKTQDLIKRRNETKDSLELTCIQLIDLLKDELSIPTTHIGIGGSILCNIHMPFSNISAIIYGEENVKKYYENVINLVANNENASFRKIPHLEYTPIPEESLNKRIKNWLYFNEKKLVIHFNVERNRSLPKYGSERYKNIKPITIKGRIFNVFKGLTTRNYEFEPENHEPPIERIIIYGGPWKSILFKEGETVQVTGLLQEIITQENKDKRYQIILGTQETAQEYLVPKE
jgi:predicted nucleotidyltransferase